MLPPLASKYSVQSGQLICHHEGQCKKHVGFELVDYVYPLQHPVGIQLHLSRSQVYISWIPSTNKGPGTQLSH